MDMVKEKRQRVVIRFALLIVAAMVILAVIEAPSAPFVGPLLILAVLGYPRWRAAGRDDHPRY